jgi:hypothetical protein
MTQTSLRRDVNSVVEIWATRSRQFTEEAVSHFLPYRSRACADGSVFVWKHHAYGRYPTDLDVLQHLSGYRCQLYMRRTR